MPIESFDLKTDANGAYDITPDVQRVIGASGVECGIAVVALPHTTAGVCIISFPDRNTLDDVMDELARLVPTRVDFKHQHDTPQDAAGHIKSAIVGCTLSLLVDGGAPVLGHSQKIYFLEFDGPRARTVNVGVVGGEA
jgi:secondary thiamine-phosphate synthase enzyme